MRTLWFKRTLFTLSSLISVGLGVLVALFFPNSPLIQLLVVVTTSAVVFFLVVLFLVFIASILMVLFGIEEDFFEQ